MTPPGVRLAGTRLVVVRHGEATCNAEDYIGGHGSCRGLTARGRAQVAALGRRLRRTGELEGPAAVWTSVLPRARQTGAAVAEALGVEVAGARCDLCERHPGEADGLTWAAYEARYARTPLPSGAGDDLPFAPGGESWTAFVDRAAGALEDLAVAHAGRLVVAVAHGGVVDASLIAFLGLPARADGIRFHAEHTSLTEWRHTGACWQLVRYSDAAHLAGADGLQVPHPAWLTGDAEPGSVSPLPDAAPPGGGAQQA